MDATAIAALGAIIVSIIGAIFTGLTSLKNTRKVEEVQHSVNDGMATTQARNDQVTTTLAEHGVVVPPVPAVVMLPPPPQ